MSANITINPSLTSVAAGTFNTSSVGLVQGTAYPDPSTRFALAGGVLASTETVPMWGGVGIYEQVPGAGTFGTRPMVSLGSIVGRGTAATGNTGLSGFSVFDQAYGMINSPQSPVPLIGSYGQVMYYRLGSRARIAVACDPALVDLQGETVTSQVSWDYVNQLLIPYVGTLTISSGTYNNTTGLVTLTMSAPVTFSAGDAIIVSGLTGTAINGQNGTYTALSASGTTVTYLAAAALGATTITGGSVTLGSGASTALAVDVLDVQTSNCQTVVYNATTGFATWNYNSSAAVILI